MNTKTQIQQKKQEMQVLEKKIAKSKRLKKIEKIIFFPLTVIAWVIWMVSMIYLENNGYTLIAFLILLAITKITNFFNTPKSIEERLQKTKEILNLMQQK